jgi:outer membrane lipoprotein SlyB
MKKLALAGLLALTAIGALADNPHGLPPGIAKKMQGGNHHPQQVAACDDCGRVAEVRQEKRKGSGGAVGIVGGAVVGGLLGNQIGKGTGNTVATVGGAVTGGFAGNEVQKHVGSKTVWVTRVTLRDGSHRSFEQEAQPAWKAGSLVKVHGKGLSLVGA